MTAQRPGTVLILSQVFAPDPAAVGQYMTDAALRLASRGVDVRVLTAAGGYEDPARRYPARQEMQGVRIRRLRFASTGKSSLARRLIGQLSFVVQCAVRGLLTRNLGAILTTTSPPFGMAAALLVGGVRRVPVHYWLMDVNPDQAVVTGQVSVRSPLTRALEWLNRQTLRRATTVIALDRAMAERITAKGPVAASVAIIPPWPLDTYADPNPDGTDWFRRRHGLEGKRVVMYSGNHSPVHPLGTLLEAAERLEGRTDLAFAFVGGGLEKVRVEDEIAAGAKNLVSIPYQPLESIGASLSAADVHVVVLGDDMRGIVHPSKLYTALLVGRPILYIGPESHVTDLLDRHAIGWRVAQGDVAGTVAVLTEIADAGEETLRRMGDAARGVALEEFDPGELSARLCDIVAPVRR